MTAPITTANPDGTFTHTVTFDEHPNIPLVALVKRLEAEMPKPSRLTILVNPADVLPDRSFSEPVQRALAPFKDQIVGLPIDITVGAPVGEPLLIDWSDMKRLLAQAGERLKTATEAATRSVEAWNHVSVSLAGPTREPRKPRGLRRHIRRVKAETRRRA